MSAEFLKSFNYIEKLNDWYNIELLGTISVYEKKNE